MKIMHLLIAFIASIMFTSPLFSMESKDLLELYNIFKDKKFFSNEELENLVVLKVHYNQKDLYPILEHHKIPAALQWLLEEIENQIDKDNLEDINLTTGINKFEYLVNLVLNNTIALHALNKNIVFIMFRISNDAGLKKTNEKMLSNSIIKKLFDSQANMSCVIL